LWKFFEIFSEWEWGPDKPVYISDIEKTPTDWKSKIKPWNPEETHTLDKYVMPIITPSFPCSNTAYNVNKALLDFIKIELCNAYKVLNEY